MDVYQPVGIGTDFLGYRIEELIGRGGMGVVYRAYDLRLKRTVALKLVAPSLARDEQFRERFARESELVMSLEHPNVVPIYDAGDVDGRVYLAMRLVDGTDLGSLLRTEGALEPARAMAICTQIAAALDAAHQRGLVHRDVKPSNVLLDSSDHVYLADFGLTRRLDDEAGGVGEDGTVGTPAYLAPEQLEGRPVDGRADLYSLGCLLYECLTGELVFPRGTRLAAAWAHLEEEPPHPSKRRAGLPEAIDLVISRAMAKEPEQRFPTCATFVTAAQDAFGLEKTRSPHRRRTLLLLAGAIGLTLGVAGVVTATILHRSPLRAGPNTLARIDPATNKVSAVIPVGANPVVAAGADYTVWVYSPGSGRLTQVNGLTNHVDDTRWVPRPAACCSLFTGPVLTADASGAWFVGGGTAGRGALLVHMLVGDRGRNVAYPLGPVTPTGVATSGSAVWVVGHDSEGDVVLRIDPESVLVTSPWWTCPFRPCATPRTAAARVRFPASARIDSIAFGHGAVWVLSSATATLYKINPHTTRLVGRPLVVTHSRATRPEIMPRGNGILIRATELGGVTFSIQPSPLRVASEELDDPPNWEENEGTLGSLWWYHQPAGVVNRQQVADGPIIRIPVTSSRPAAGGPCLTSMAEASGSIWVTVAPLHGSHCTR